MIGACRGRIDRRQRPRQRERGGDGERCDVAGDSRDDSAEDESGREPHRDAAANDAHVGAAGVAIRDIGGDRVCGREHSGGPDPPQDASEKEPPLRSDELPDERAPRAGPDTDRAERYLSKAGGQPAERRRRRQRDRDDVPERRNTLDEEPGDERGPRPVSVDEGARGSVRDEADESVRRKNEPDGDGGDAENRPEVRQNWEHHAPTESDEEGARYHREQHWRKARSPCSRPLRHGYCPDRRSRASGRILLALSSVGGRRLRGYGVRRLAGLCRRLTSLCRRLTSLCRRRLCRLFDCSL